jgi:preprotein translocase subunit SecE
MERESLDRASARFRRSRKQLNPMATINPAQYVREVIGEVKKVTWPTKKETTVTTIMVFIMVALAAIFFLLVDLGLSWIVRNIIGLGG